MSVQPYTPTPFATPVVNPAVGGAGAPIPYVSVSGYRYAPTAMDTGTLVPGGSQADQDRALADTIRRASGWADRVCLGADAASAGASLAATLSVQSARVPVLGGYLRLVCDYKPIVSVNGIDLGADMGSLSALADPSGVRIGRRTVYVPVNAGIIGRDNGTLIRSAAGVVYTVVWSYVNGYPHTSLTAAVTAGDTTLQVAATDGAAGLLAVMPGTRMSIIDGAATESFTVASVTGTTITTVAPLAYDHLIPVAPDFLPVTAIPAEVEQALVFMTTALIKTRGDNSLTLEGVTEPTALKSTAGDMWSDVQYALDLLKPYRVRLKAG